MIMIMDASKGKNGQKTKSTLGQFVRQRKVNRVILSKSHPLYRTVKRQVARFDGATLSALLNSTLLLDPAEWGVTCRYGAELPTQDVQKEYRGSELLSDLRLATIGSRRAADVEPGIDARLGTLPKIYLDIVRRLDRAHALRSRVNYILTAKEKDQDTSFGNDEPYHLEFEFQALRLTETLSSGASRFTPESHARKMLKLLEKHQQIFALLVNGRFIEALDRARSLPTTGRDSEWRTPAIICVLVHFQVHAAEHAQRAHAWVRVARKASISDVLSGDIEPDGEIRMGGVIALNRMLAKLSVKWVIKVKPSGPATAQADRPSGPRGNADTVCEEIVLDQFLGTSKQALDAIGTAIFPKKSAILAGVDTVMKLADDANAHVDIMTHWFGGVTEREALQMISMRLCQSRENIQMLIDNPDMIMGVDLLELLYPLTLSSISENFVVEVRRQCLQLISLADERVNHSGVEWLDDAEEHDVASGNKRSTTRAHRALARISARRDAGLPAADKLEQFFKAFDPLRRPSVGGPALSSGAVLE